MKKQFRLTNVEVVIETKDDDMTEAEALEILAKKPYWFLCQGIGHDANSGKTIILFSEDDQ